ncbi:MAG: hypothetical protein AAGD04_16325 [Pseudomonadota bacterium]
MQLPSELLSGNNARAELVVLEQRTFAYELSPGFSDAIRHYLVRLRPEHRLSLRETSQIVANAKIIEVAFKNKRDAWYSVAAGLLILRVAKPALFQRFIDDTLPADFYCDLLIKDKTTNRIIEFWRHFYSARSNSEAESFGFEYEKHHHRRTMLDAITQFTTSL